MWVVMNKKTFDVRCHPAIAKRIESAYCRLPDCRTIMRKKSEQRLVGTRIADLSQRPCRLDCQFRFVQNAEQSGHRFGITNPRKRSDRGTSRVWIFRFQLRAKRFENRTTVPYEAFNNVLSNLRGA